MCTAGRPGAAGWPGQGIASQPVHGVRRGVAALGTKRRWAAVTGHGGGEEADRGQQHEKAEKVSMHGVWMTSRE